MWWQDDNLSKKFIDHKMCVHVFGDTSSPSCGNYVLKRTAIDREDQFRKAAAMTLQDSFYVDDLLKSLDNEKEAIKLIMNVKAMHESGGFKLTKFLSNSKQVFQSVDEADRRQGVKDKDLMGDLPAEQALGVLWGTEIDKFGFRVTLKQKSWTRRGLRSVISSVYDPLGFAAPFPLQGKLLIQQLCKENLGWDETIPDNIQKQWAKWERQLKELEGLSVDRCFKQANFGKIVDCSLHHFADACEHAYGQASYLRIVDETGRIHCCLVIGK